MTLNVLGTILMLASLAGTLWAIVKQPTSTERKDQNHA